jgi:hypothetical protein
MITIVQGDDRTITFTLKTAAGIAYDLAGCTLFVTVKRNYEDTDSQAVISDTLTVSVPASGIGYWILEPADTKNLLGLYKYDIQLKDAATKISTILVDEITVDPEVTIRIV